MLNCGTVEGQQRYLHLCLWHPVVLTSKPYKLCHVSTRQSCRGLIMRQIRYAQHTAAALQLAVGLPHRHLHICHLDNISTASARLKTPPKPCTCLCRATCRLSYLCMRASSLAHPTQDTSARLAHSFWIQCGFSLS